MESSSSFFLPRMVGYSNATYLLTTGARFKANSSVLQGIFAELVPEPQDVLPRAIEIAKDVLENVSTMAAHLNRQLIWRNPGSAERAHLVDSPLLFDMFGSKSVFRNTNSLCVICLLSSGIISSSKNRSSRNVRQNSPTCSQRMHLGHTLGGLSSQSQLDPKLEIKLDRSCEV